jgi:hypothetical protein
VADAWGYGASYVAAAAVELLTLPFLLLARGERAPPDRVAPAVAAPASPTPVGQGGAGT